MNTVMARSWGQTIHVTNHDDISCLIIGLGDSEKGIPSKEDKEMADKIVTSLNCHDELLEALKECRTWYEKRGAELLNGDTPICFSKALSAILNCRI